MAGAASAKNAAIVGINVTPLVDVTLVLLVIFMVTARLIVAPRAVALDLPKAETGQSTQEIFSVELPSTGVLQVNGEVVANDERVVSLAHAALHQNRELRAVIRADGSVAHRNVIHALDLLRRAGISRVGFGVAPGSDAPAEAR